MVSYLNAKIVKVGECLRYKDCLLGRVDATGCVLSDSFVIFGGLAFLRYFRVLVLLPIGLSVWIGFPYRTLRLEMRVFQQLFSGKVRRGDIVHTVFLSRWTEEMMRLTGSLCC